MTKEQTLKKILEMLNKIWLHLTGDEPERDLPKDPVGLPKHEPPKKPYDMPEIKYHDIKVPIRGKYKTPSKKAQGLVVHFTAGWNNKGEQSAVNTIKDMVKRGLYCPVMDINGVIHASKWADIEGDYGYHAGKSAWLGKSALSKYLIGMEICNGGRLTNGKTWFGYKPPFTRTVKEKDNVKAGTYEAFTPAQEKSLINFLMWQLDTNPEFKTWWVVGHDEIAPLRKDDPSGALSMTMPELRALIRSKQAEAARTSNALVFEKMIHG